MKTRVLNVQVTIEEVDLEDAITDLRAQADGEGRSAAEREIRNLRKLQWPQVKTVVQVTCDGRKLSEIVHSGGDGTEIFWPLLESEYGDTSLAVSFFPS